MPLGGCTISACEEQGHPFSIHIISDELNVSIAVSSLKILSFSF